MLLAGLAVLVSSLCCHRQRETDRIEALKEFRDQVDNTLPRIASLTGIQRREPVKVDLLTRAELGKFFEPTIKVEYPNEVFSAVD